MVVLPTGFAVRLPAIVKWMGKFWKVRESDDEMDTFVNGFDVIGDVHGCADALEALLEKMGYRRQHGIWSHPDRTAVFVGDLIDRGSQQREVVEIVRSMVDAGSARIVLGNHEFNAVAWHTPDLANPGSYHRTRRGPTGDKNREQHEAFLTQIGEDSPLHNELIQWFTTIPLWIDLGGLRVVHACWSTQDMDAIVHMLDPDNSLTMECLVAACQSGTIAYEAIETILKGPELHMGGRAYRDKSGHVRKKARLRWWDPTATTLHELAEIPPGSLAPNGEPFGALPHEPVDPDHVPRYTDEIPVIFGHYWRTGEPHILNPTAACVDFSAVVGGPMVAYRWSGETELDPNHLVFAHAK